MDSEKKLFPRIVKVNANLVDLFFESKVALTSDFTVFSRGGGWLQELSEYTFNQEIFIEGPSGLYGGVYNANPWNLSGGLCTIGAASYSHSPLPEGMVVGRYCSIAKGLKILDFMHPTEWLSSSVAFFKPTNATWLTSIHSLIEEDSGDFERSEFDPKNGMGYPIIGNDVWIGENVTLSLGISIGSGSVIAAGSIVTKDVEPYSIVGGVPAKLIKYRFERQIIESLLELEWWKYSFADFACMDYKQPDCFIKQLQSKIFDGEIQLWRPKRISLPYDFLN